MRLRQLAPAALILALTVAGFVLARVLTHRDAHDEAKQRAEVAAAQVDARIAQAVSLTESLRRSMLDAGGTGLTSDQFARIALRWLTPADFSAAAWIERIPDSERAAYELRIGGPIVTPNDRRVVAAGSRSSYLPATLVSGFAPMDVSGIDLSAEPGMAMALDRAARANGVAATALTDSTAGTGGLFLVAPASNLVNERLRPGYVVVFVSDQSLREAAPAAPNLRLAGGGGATTSFIEAGQRFEVGVPQESPHGGEAALPWIILAGGLTLAGLAAALAVNSARRAKTQDELDRIFNLSPDLITVADFEGHFTRVNPAVESVLGYSQEEFLAKPYVDLVHPDDRERTQAEATAIAHGKRTLSFSNRYRHKDGSYRTLEWTATPVVEDGLMYGVARDVTERQAAETELERLADEQTALRRVATAVARGSTPQHVFGVVAEEVARLLGADSGTVDRYLEDAECTVVGSWGKLGEAFPLGSRWPLDDLSCSSLVYRTKRPARIENYEQAPGDVAHEAHKVGVRSAVGSPIIVDGRLWGALVAGTTSREPLPADAEVRMTQFTELVATAISNVQSRAEVERLADGQAALRRVAELVAREAPQAEVFRAIAVEVGQLFGTEEIRMWRYETDRETAVVVGTAGSEGAFPLGVRHDMSGDSAAARVLRSGRPSRLDSYDIATGPVADTARAIGVRSAVGVPVIVEGRLWGAIVTGSTKSEPLPPGTESRLAEFTELMAAAIANTEARTEVERLAQEQAALRRVATLVAQGASPGTVLDAVAGEMEALLNADQVALNRFEPGDEILVMAHRGLDVGRTPVGSRMSISGQSATATVRRTARPARMENYENAEGALAELARETGLRSSVSVPIVVDGRLWGLITASWKGEEPPPAHTEERMSRFAELLDTAIANADTRAQLTASRARLVTEADEARRRVVRDLHDGAQQRLVHTIVTLKLAQRARENGDGKLDSLIDEALAHAERGNSELRELAHGILPSVLTRGGLTAAVGTVVERIDLPVDVDVPSQRFPAEIEASAYFIVAEALTNVVKHSNATRAEVRASVQDGALHVQVQDDGIGGADPGGHGLVGMNDRVSALGGRLSIGSPAGGGTTVTATLPLAGG